MAMGQKQDVLINLPDYRQYNDAAVQMLRQLLGNLAAPSVSAEVRRQGVHIAEAAADVQSAVAALDSFEAANNIAETGEIAIFLGPIYLIQGPSGATLESLRAVEGRAPIYKGGFHTARQLHNQVSVLYFMQTLEGWGLPCAAQTQAALENFAGLFVRPWKIISRNWGRYRVGVAPGGFEYYDPSQGSMAVAQVNVTCPEDPGMVFRYGVVSPSTNILQPYQKLQFLLPRRLPPPVRVAVEPPPVPAPAPAPVTTPVPLLQHAPAAFQPTCEDAVYALPAGKIQSGKKLVIRPRAGWRVQDVFLVPGRDNEDTSTPSTVEGNPHGARRWYIRASGVGQRTLLVDVSGPNGRTLSCNSNLQLKKRSLLVPILVGTVVAGGAVLLWLATRNDYGSKTSGQPNGGGGRGAIPAPVSGPGFWPHH